MIRGRTAGTYVGVLAFSLATGCTTATSDEATGADDLIGGRAAKGHEFPATVYLASGCTAAKVAPRLLLTAAHCVVDPATADVVYPSGSKLQISVAPTDGYTDAEVASVRVHPTWTRACQEAYCAASSVTATLDAADVAVIELKSDIDSVPVATVVAAPLAIGDAVTVVGFGCTRGVQVRDRRRRTPLKAADTSLVAPERAIHAGSPLSASDMPRVASTYLMTDGPGATKSDAGLCPGDSGGPLYRRAASGAYEVVGVNSNYTLGPEASDTLGLPITNWYTRLDSASRHGIVQWLREVGVASK